MDFGKERLRHLLACFTYKHREEALLVFSFPLLSASEASLLPAHTIWHPENRMSAPLAAKEDRNVLNICHIPWLVLTELFGMELWGAMELCKAERREKHLQQSIVFLEVNVELQDWDKKMHHDDTFDNAFYANKEEVNY